MITSDQNLQVVTSTIILNKAAYEQRENILKSLLKIQNSVIENLEIKENLISFYIDGHLASIVLEEKVVPVDYLNNLCSWASWYWPNSKDVIVNQKSHLILSIVDFDKTDSLEKVKLLTKLTTAVAKNVEALGICWGSYLNQMVALNQVETFLNDSADLEHNFPSHLWVSYFLQVFQEERKCNIITLGLEQFGIMEVEVVKSEKLPQEALEFVMNIAQYLIENGMVIKDGDTVGSSNEQLIKVVYRDSIINRTEKVMGILF